MFFELVKVCEKLNSCVLSFFKLARIWCQIFSRVSIFVSFWQKWKIWKNKEDLSATLTSDCNPKLNTYACNPNLTPVTVTLTLTHMPVTLTLIPKLNPYAGNTGFHIWKVDPTKCFVGCEVRLFFCFLCFFFFLDFHFFQNETKMDTLEKVWHRNQSNEKSICLKKLLTLQTTFSEPWFLPNFDLWAYCRKFCTRRNFEFSKEPKTHVWKHVLILN